MKIKDAVVVLTGASSGIARLTARTLASRGAKVVLASRDADALEEVVDECTRAGGSAIAVPTDVSDLGAVEELAAKANAAFGQIDAWVNAAAVMAYGEFEKVPWEIYRHIIDTNLFGQIHGARAVLPYFRKQGGGVLVNVASVWGSVTSPYVSAYVVSKFGVRAFSECLQESLWLEPETRRVRVCTILPQSVDTPIFRHAANYTDQLPKPVPPIVEPARVVRAIVRSIEHPRRQRTVGMWGRFLELGHAAIPSVYDHLVPRVMNVAAFRHESGAKGPGNVFEPMHEWNQAEGHWRFDRRIVAGGVAAASASGLLAAAVSRDRVQRRLHSLSSRS